MSDTLHVTHAVLTLEVGGLERIVVDLVREGQRLGQRVSVLCLERPGPLAAQVEALGARVVCTGKPPGLHFSAGGTIRTALQELRPDVLHTHQIGALFYAGRQARALGVPVIVHTEHINNIRKEKSKFFRRQRMCWLWWWAAKYARRFFCVSEDIAAELAARRIVPRGKLAVILNGINTEPFRGPFDKNALRHAAGIPADIPVIGTVGRLNEVKRQDLLLRAFACLRAEYSTSRLLLVGDGPLRDSLRNLSVDLGLADAVHFAGYQNQPERFLAMMDVFALTSRLEGLPLAILEAWAAGLPVVASAVGGVPDVVEHGRTGLLFASGDQDKLAGLLKEMLLHSDRARRLGEAGRQEVLAKYDLHRMAGDYERHYCELLSCPSATGWAAMHGVEHRVNSALAGTDR
ncbi:MAG TPA: glycosyltransferase [Gemmataceae bacterium]|nr:glycosyltransferase [Gemmataceae bacterium]